MKLIKLWLPPLAWAGLIFYFSSIPYLKTELEYDYLFRKIAHVSEYFILTFLLYRAFKGSFKISRLSLFIYPASLALFYAISDEIHQHFVLGRYCAAGDILIDSLGIVIFYILIIRVK